MGAPVARERHRCLVRVPFPAHARLPIGRAVRQALQGMGAMMQGIQGMPNMGGMPMGPGMHRRLRYVSHPVLP